MSKVRHLLGISGGKDSAALALYLGKNYPGLDFEFYTCDTGKELNETYELISRLESVLGKKISKYSSFDDEHVVIQNPFDHFLSVYGHFLPSSQARWCTTKMKLEPFEQNIGNHPTISYVGIRGDENREGYISKNPNIQTIFPFRKNIWSSDVTKLAISNSHLETFVNGMSAQLSDGQYERFNELANTKISPTFSVVKKIDSLLNLNVRAFNYGVFEVLKETNHPVGMLDSFELLDNEESLGINEIYGILDDSGVGIPAYYLPVEFSVEENGEVFKGTYSRSRSGCFFCFYQQKIEWVWLLEQHPGLFEQAVEYEKDGYTWSEEPLKDLAKPDRVKKIKLDYIKRMDRKNSKSSNNWQDEILNAEGDGCASCFI